MPLEFRTGSFRVRFLAALVLSALAATLSPPARASLASRTAWVISSLDGRLARVDLDAGVVTPNLASTGSSPNRIVTSAGDLFAFITCSGASTLDVFDLLAESSVGSVVLPPGSNPWDAEPSPAGDVVFVTSLLGDRVDVVDPWGGGVVDDIAVGVAPEGMCVAAGKLFVANTAFDFGTFSYGPGTVSVVDLGTRSVVATISVGLNPQECITTPGGEVHVVCTGDFFTTTGRISIVDPATNAVVDAIEIAAYPGSAAADTAGLVTIGVTTTSFASEIWRYDAATRTLVNDGSNPLFSTGEFLGNPKLAKDGSLLVPNFTQDLLLVDDPGPGLLEAYLVGDGPVDCAVVERSGTVSLALSGLRVSNQVDGVLLAWNATPEAGLLACVVERAAPGSTFERVASDLAVARSMTWLDRTPPDGRTARYRVGGVDVRGHIEWLPEVTITRAAPAAALFVHAGPNPFRTSTTIRVQGLSGSAARASAERGTGTIELGIFDVTGRAVAEHEAAASATSFDWTWDGRDRRGRELAPGAYFVRVAADGKQATTRLLRLR